MRSIAAEAAPRRASRKRCATANGMLAGQRALFALATMVAMMVAMMVAVISGPAPAHAQTASCPRCTDVGEAPDALPGIAEVPVAVLRPAMGGAVVASGGLALSIDEPWEGAERFRAHGSIAGALHPVEWLAIGIRAQGRWEQIDLGEGAGGDSGLVGFPTLTVRATTEPVEGLGLALDAAVWMLGGEAPSLEPSSTSLRARAVVSYRFSIDEVRVALTAAVGGLLDNSRGAAARDVTDRLSDEDRLSLGISDHSAVLAGLGGIVGLGAAEIFAEVSYRALVGSAAPDPGASPLHVVAGARIRPIGEVLELGAYADVLASAADPALVAPGGPMAPIDPRFTLTLSVGLRLGWDAAASVEEAGDETVGPGDVVVAPGATTGRITGRVMDETGAPVAGAGVEVVPASDPATGTGAPQSTTSDADGRWSIDGLPAGTARVIVTRDGHEPRETTIEVRAGEEAEVATSFAAELPRGEIRGTIQGSDGRPLAGAEIRIRPSGTVLSTDADGAFETEVPPGTYEVEVRAPRHRSQTRQVEVVERGVVLLNAQLHRAR